MLNEFTNLIAGEQIMHQIRFGWNLLLSHRSAEEARLHFVSAMAKFPESPFLLRELAASAVLGPHVLPRLGDDGHMLQQDQSGNWAHLKTQSDFTASALDAWETSAAIRFKAPKGFLSEEEPELLAAGMPAYAFIPGVLTMLTAEGDNAAVGLSEKRLQHDMELYKLLEGKGLLHPKVALLAIQACDRLIRGAKVKAMEPTVEQWHSVYPFYNRRLYIHPCPRLPGKALNPSASLQTRLLPSTSHKASRAGSFLSTGEQRRNMGCFKLPMVG